MDLLNMKNVKSMKKPAALPQRVQVSPLEGLSLAKRVA